MAPIHASAFAFEGMGCLLMGQSGSGKTTLLAQALIHGAHLIADDRVELTVGDGVLAASAPHQLHGVIELRGLGLIRHAALAGHPLHLAITLNVVANERLPEFDFWEYGGMKLPHLSLRQPPIASLMLYLRAMQEGRILPTDWHPVG